MIDFIIYILVGNNIYLPMIIVIFHILIYVGKWSIQKLDIDYGFIGADVSTYLLGVDRQALLHKRIELTFGSLRVIQ